MRSGKAEPNVRARLPRLSRLADAVRDADDVDHLPHAVHPDDVRAEEDARGDRRGRAPFPGRRLALADGGFQKRFAGWAREDRAIERGQRVEVRQHVVAVFGLLGESEARIDDDRITWHPRPHRARDGLLELPCDVPRRILVDGQVVHAAGAAARVHQDQRRAARGATLPMLDRRAAR